MRSGRRGFTLTELLIVIGLIVLVLALSVPMFRYITGARSEEGALNLANAMLARARSLAMSGSVSGNPQQIGVMFFVDPVSGRSSMALVSRGATEADPFDQYKQWQSGADYYQNPEPQHVVHMTGTGGEKRFTKFYRCKKEPNQSQTPGPNSTYWEEWIPFELSLVADTDLQLLPAGIGAQLINDPRGSSNADRYLRTGVVLFDRQGRLSRVRYGVRSTSDLGQVMGLNGHLNPSQGAYSQFGLVVYDREAFAGDPGRTDTDPLYGGKKYGSAELAEEDWLDKNTTPRLVNRTNGTLLAGE